MNTIVPFYFYQPFLKPPEYKLNTASSYLTYLLAYEELQMYGSFRLEERYPEFTKILNDNILELF